MQIAYPSRKMSRKVCLLILFDYQAFNTGSFLASDAFQCSQQMWQSIHTPMADDETDIGSGMHHTGLMEPVDWMISQCVSHQFEPQNRQMFGCVQIRSPLPVTTVANAIRGGFKLLGPVMQS